MVKTLTTLLGAALMAIAMTGGTSAEEARKCYPLATLKISFNVVFPEAKQVTMAGYAAKAYLDAYNNFGKKTEFEGETLLLNTLPNGTTLLVPVKEGLGCKRVIVGPKLHRIIMAKVERGSV